MTAITNTTVLSTFSIVRDAILNNSTLSKKFNTSNIYQYEPKHKSRNFKGFPYFWVNIPSKDSEKAIFNNSFTEDLFEITVLLRVDYEAREVVLDYVNAFNKAIQDYESVFQASGYYDVMVDLIDVNSNQQIEQKELVEVEFVVGNHGQVLR